jgi:hypothetical protein
VHPSVGTRDTGWWGGAAQRDAGVGAQQRPSAVRQRDRPLAPPYPTVAIGMLDSIFPRLFLTDSIFPSLFSHLGSSAPRCVPAGGWTLSVGPSLPPRGVA